MRARPCKKGIRRRSFAVASDPKMDAEYSYGTHIRLSGDREGLELRRWGGRQVEPEEIGAMRNLGVLSALAMIVMAAAGCNTPQERAVSGGAIGAAGGAVVGQAIGRNTGSTLAGAAIGGVAGAMIGAGTAPGECRFQQLDSRGRPVFDRHGQPVTYLAPCRR